MNENSATSISMWIQYACAISIPVIFFTLPDKSWYAIVLAAGYIVTDFILNAPEFDDFDGHPIFAFFAWMVYSIFMSLALLGHCFALVGILKVLF